MQNKHTNGKWKIYDACLPARGIIEIQADRKTIANVKRLVKGKCYDISQCEEAGANAKLMAAAPELLKALVLAYGMMVIDTNYQGRNVLETMQAAIKSAT